MGTTIIFRRGENDPTSGSGLTLAEPAFNTTLKTFHIGLGHGVTAAWVGAPISGLSADIAAGITYKTPTASAVKNYIGGLCYGNTGAATITQYVSSFNGLTGAVTGVTVGGANTFTALNSFNAGISASGATFSGTLSGATATFSSLVTSNGGISGNINISSTNDTGNMYLVMSRGAGVTALFVDDATTPLVYQPYGGNLGVKGLTVGTGNDRLYLTPTQITATNTVTPNNASFYFVSPAIYLQSGDTAGMAASGSTRQLTWGDFVNSIQDCYFGVNRLDGGMCGDYAVEINHSTGKALQLIYNDYSGAASNWVNMNVTSGGDLTITPSGGDATISGRLFADNIVNALNGFTGGVTLAAGAGISLSAATGSVTITNTGVQSFNGNTGAVTGVSSINGLTGTVTNVARTNVDNSFSVPQTIVGSGASLTISATNDGGSGITLDPSSNTISWRNGLLQTTLDFNPSGGSQVVTLPEFTTTLAGLSGTQTFGGTKTFNARTNFNAGISAAGGTFSALVTFASGISASGGITLASPNLTGIPTATTAVVGTNTTQIATTAFVQSEIVADTVTAFNGRTGSVQGVSAAVAGSFISVSGATGTVTITNTGVQSFNGLTGAVGGVCAAQANTFTALNSFNAGISAAGGTFSALTRFTAGISAAGGITFNSNVTINSANTLNVTSIVSDTGTQLSLEDTFDARVSIGDYSYNANGTFIFLRDAISTIYLSNPFGTIGIGDPTSIDSGNSISYSAADATLYGNNSNLEGFANIVNALNGFTSGVTLAAGTGISVSGATGAVTITNTGVQSFNGNTGAVTGASLGANTFTALNSFNAGISAAGGTFSALTIFTAGISASGGMTLGGSLQGSTATFTGNVTGITFIGGLSGNATGIIINATSSSSELFPVLCTSTTSTVARADTTAPRVSIIPSTGQLTAPIFRVASTASGGAFTEITDAGVITANGDLTLRCDGNILSLGDVDYITNGCKIVIDNSSGLIDINAVGSPLTLTGSSVSVSGLLNASNGISAAGGTFSALTRFTAGISAAGGVTFSGTVSSDTGYRITSSAINAQTGTTYTFLDSDNGKIVTFNNGSAVTVTIPTALPVGFNCTAIQLGTGQVGFTAASGLTLNSYGNQYRLIGQHASASIIEYTTNIVNLSGNLVI